MRVIGIKDVYFAKELTNTTLGSTYDAPIKIAKALLAKIAQSLSSEEWWSDDELEEIPSMKGNISVEIGLNDLSMASRAALQGITTSNGEIVETKDDVAPFGALLFRAKTSTGKYRYVVLYRGRFEIPDDSYETQDNTVKSQTPTLKGTFYPRADGKTRFILDENETGASAAKIAAWFTAVQEPGASS